jgi:hypothetical protein
MKKAFTIIHFSLGKYLGKNNVIIEEPAITIRINMEYEIILL